MYFVGSNNNSPIKKSIATPTRKPQQQKSDTHTTTQHDSQLFNAKEKEKREGECAFYFLTAPPVVPMPMTVLKVS